jgi:hypothetical protein
MKRVVFMISLTFAVSLLVAQDLDQILEKTNKAIGAEARSKIKHMQSNGHYVMSGTDAKMPFKLQQSKPNNIRIEITIFGLKGIQTYDGQHAWMLNPLQGTEAKPADPEDMKFISATTAIDGPFLNRTDKRTPSYIGAKEYKGSPCFVVRITKSMEEHIDYYINTQTYLFDFIRYEYKKNGGWYSMEYKVIEYMNFEGGVFPGEISVAINGVEMTSIYVKKMKIVPEMAERLFMKPSY